MFRRFLRAKAPPSPPTLPEPWRNVTWGNRQRDLQFVRDYHPHNNDLQQLRILLCGQIGSGKSSFINSVDMTLKGRLAGQALADTVAAKSFTKKLSTYKIQKESPQTHHPFVFIDTMGLEKGQDQGICVDDIILAMKGHIQDNYEFNPCSSISVDNPRYNETPTLNDQIHVLVFVVAADPAETVTPNLKSKMRDIRLAASRMGIPQLAILTKIDAACPEVQRDIRNVYKSKLLKSKIEELSVSCGLPVSYIFPVKNYHSAIDTHEDTDVLILSTLKNVIYLGEDFVNRL